MQARHGSIAPCDSLCEVNCEKRKKEKKKKSWSESYIVGRENQSNCEIVFSCSLKVSRLRLRCCCCCYCCWRAVSLLVAEARTKKGQPRGRVLAQFTTNRNFKIESHPESPIAQLTEESDDLVDKFVGRECVTEVYYPTGTRSLKFVHASLLILSHSSASRRLFRGESIGGKILLNSVQEKRPCGCHSSGTRRSPVTVNRRSGINWLRG